MVQLAITSKRIEVAREKRTRKDSRRIMGLKYNFEKEVTLSDHTTISLGDRPTYENQSRGEIIGLGDHPGSHLVTAHAKFRLFDVDSEFD